MDASRSMIKLLWWLRHIVKSRYQSSVNSNGQRSFRWKTMTSFLRKEHRHAVEEEDEENHLARKLLVA
ncbi:hypothetical protein FCV25MIE_04485, partial [Fagus crenata]